MSVNSGQEIQRVKTLVKTGPKGMDNPAVDSYLLSLYRGYC